MPNRRFSEAFSHMLSAFPSHHVKYFDMLDIITEEDPSLSYPVCLQVALYILSHMDATFVERRGIDLFRFLLRHLSCENHPSNKGSTCMVTSLLHEVAFPFQNKHVLGLFVQLSGTSVEVASLKHSLLDRHRNILLIEHTTLPVTDWKRSRTFLYFEVQKRDGNFSPDEIDDLLESLEDMAFSLTSRWHAKIPSSESSFKMLRYLMSEVKEGDLPHAFIDLCEQRTNQLAFLVLLSEVKGSDQSPFAPLLAHPDVCKKMHLIEGKKEGMALQIELSHSLTLSLVEGRKKITEWIEASLGPFRDVNGGLLEKIEQNFQTLSQIVPKSNGRLRTFFDSIQPEETRAIISPRVLKEIYLASQNMREEGGDAYRLIDQEGWIAALVKGDQEQKKEWDATLSHALPEVSCSHLADTDQLILSAFALMSHDEKRAAFKKETRALFDTWQRQKESLQVLRLCTTSRFTSFDPRTGTEEETSYLHKMLFEGLMRIDKAGKPEPAIAEKVTISEDGKCYRFFLRTSTWSNGMPLTAHDFLYSWQMVLTRKDLAPLSYLFDCIENAHEIKEGSLPVEHLGVTVLDDNTLDVKLLSPCTPFLEICALTLFSPICQAVDEKHPSWSACEGDDYVCNGPFCLEKKETNGGVILKSNPLYWEVKKVRLKQITIPLVSQEEGKRLFLRGKIDALLFYFYKHPASISAQTPNIQTLEGGTFVRYLCFDCSRPPFHNKKVRQAIALAIDREATARSISNNSTVCQSFYPPEHLFFQSQANFERDISRARLLIIKAIAEDQRVHSTFFKQKFHVLENSKKIGNCICHQINKVFDINWDMCTIGLATQAHTYGVGLYGWVDRLSDPGYFLGIFSKTDNPARWIHPPFQSLANRLNAAQTQTQREMLFREAEEIWREEVPLIPLAYQKTQSLHSTEICNLYSNHLQEFDIRFAFKKLDMSTVE